MDTTTIMILLGLLLASVLIGVALFFIFRGIITFVFSRIRGHRRKANFIPKGLVSSNQPGQDLQIVNLPQVSSCFIGRGWQQSEDALCRLTGKPVKSCSCST